MIFLMCAVMVSSQIFELESSFKYVKKQAGASRVGLATSHVEANNFEPSQKFLKSFVNNFFLQFKYLNNIFKTTQKKF